MPLQRMRRNRYDTSQRLDESGKVQPLVFTAGDFETCKLFAPAQGVREPWSYQYLPGPYVALLLGRGPHYFTDRLQELCCEPHNYLTQPDQPGTFMRAIVYAIGENGISELKEAGHMVPRKPLRRIEHELMSCVIAASFEHGAAANSNVSIELVDEENDFYPDWPIFRVSTPTQRKIVYIEADTGTEQFERHPSNTTVIDKIEAYLELKDKLRDRLIVFVTTRQSRRDKFIDCVKRVITEKGCPKPYARAFAASYMKYDRHLQTAPRLTDWAITGDYMRAGEPFNFLK